MVRVCINKECPNPHHVFGCVLYTGIAFNCQDCRHEKPGIYQHCTLRKIEPAPEDATHGLCQQCAPIVMASIKRNG